MQNTIKIFLNEIQQFTKTDYLFFISQIKAKLGSTYKNAVKYYNGTDSSSVAVDTIQRTVSGRFDITLMLLLLSEFVCVALYKLKNSHLYKNILKGSRLTLNHVEQKNCYS